MTAPTEPGAAPRPPVARLFFALWPPAEVAERLHAQAVRCAGTAGGRAMRRETLHLTLAFLGNVPESEIARLCEVAARVAAAPFSLRLERLGFWRRQRLVWAGCAPDGVPDELQRLAATLGDALRAAGFGLEARPFVPHVTLLRKAEPSGAPGAGDASGTAPLPPGDGAFPAVVWPAAEFVLVRSAIGAPEASYTRIGRWPLRGA